MSEDKRIEHQLQQILCLLELIVKRLPPPPIYYPSIAAVVIALP